MAKQTVLVSDLSGESIDGESASITIKMNGFSYVGDAKPEEVADLTSKLRQTKTRGVKKNKK